MNAETQAVRGAAKQMNGKKDKLLADVKNVVAEAENLLKKAKNSGAESYAAVRAELEDKLADTIVRLQEVQEELKARARYAARATDDYVHENPWKAVGVAAGIGLIGWLMMAKPGA